MPEIRKYVSDTIYKALRANNEELISLTEDVWDRAIQMLDEREDAEDPVDYKGSDAELVYDLAVLLDHIQVQRGCWSDENIRWDRHA